MSSEWMKVMLGEIARKKSEASDVQAELERRGLEQPGLQQRELQQRSLEKQTPGDAAARDGETCDSAPRSITPGGRSTE